MTPNISDTAFAWTRAWTEAADLAHLDLVASAEAGPPPTTHNNGRTESSWVSSSLETSDTSSREGSPRTARESLGGVGGAPQHFAANSSLASHCSSKYRLT